MIYKVEFTFIMGLVFISCAAAGAGVWLLRMMAPKEKMILSWAGSKEQKQAQSMFKIVIPAAAVMASLAVLSGMNFRLGYDPDRGMRFFRWVT